MTHSDFPVNIAEYIASARSDAALFRKARTTFADLSPHLWDRGDAKKTAITSSDAGRCAAQVKAECAGLYDIPDSEFTSRDSGTMNGALVACLLRVGIEERHPEYLVAIEATGGWGGIDGHTDLLVTEADGRAVWCVELKHTASFSVRPPHEPGKDATRTPANVHQILQACHRALAHGSSIATVFVQGAGGVSAQGDYEVSTWVQFVKDEYARLARGEKDATRDFQCAGCRWSKCERNRNALKPVWPGIAV